MEKGIISKSALDLFIASIPRDFQIKRLERGWNLFHEGRVSVIDHGRNHIKLMIKANKPFTVTVGLPKLTEWHCNCALKRACSHMAAAFYSLCADVGYRPELFLHHFQVEYNKRKARRAKQTTNQNKIEATSKSTKTLHQEDSIYKWQQVFEARFRNYTLTNQQSMENLPNEVNSQMLPIADDWTAERKDLFKLHICLYLVKKIEQLTAQHQQSYLSSYFERTVPIVYKQIQQQLITAIHALNNDETKRELADELVETGQFLHQFLTESTGHFQTIATYRSLWWTVLNKPEWVQSEQEKWEIVLEKTNLTPKRKWIAVYALSHFDILNQRDQQAMNRFLSLKRPIQLHQIQFYLNFFVKEQQWHRLIDWLEWLKPHINRFQASTLEKYLEYWSVANKKMNASSKWEQLLIDFLPGSFVHYTEYLLETKQFKQWIDLHLMNRISPLQVDDQMLQLIYTQEPELLLPFYHYGVEYYISTKTKDHYLLATKLLKTLKNLYDELRLEDQWKRYIDVIQRRFSRLPSLQKELKRGNLI